MAKMTTAERRVAAGVCPRCGHREPAAGRKTCQTCLDQQHFRDSMRTYKSGPQVGTVPARRRSEGFIPYRKGRDSADDGRCGRCHALLPGDIEHSCPGAPEPLRESAVMYMRTGDASCGEWWV